MDMKKYISIYNPKYLAITILLLLFTRSVQSQKLITSIDSTNIFVGEKISFNLQVYSDSLDQITFPDPKSFMPMEVLKIYDSDTIENNNEFIISKKYELTNFDAGSYILPKQKVAFGNKILYSNSTKIEVKLVEVDTTKQGLYDIKPIFTIDGPNYIYTYILVLLLIVILIGLYINRDKIFRKKAFQYEQSPYQKARNEINQLIDSNYNIIENSKEYYSRLSFTIRNFLEAKVFDHSLESTTDELLYELNRIRSNDELKFSLATLNNIQSVLNTADLVKFAKHQPEEIDARKDTETISKTIDEINEILPEPTIEELKKDYEFHQKLIRDKRRKTFKTVLAVFMAILISSLIFSSILFGFTYVKDKLLWNKNLLLLETKDWVTTEYGSPGITLKTPEVLTRELSNPTFKYENSSNLSEFGFFNHNNSMQIYVSNTKFNDKINPEDFQKYVDNSLDIIEAMGLSNILVKYEMFTTPNEAEGIRVYGSADFMDTKTNKLVNGAYSILGFFTENEFKQLIILNHKDIYLDQITDQVISSVELIKEKQE